MAALGGSLRHCFALLGFPFVLLCFPSLCRALLWCAVPCFALLSFARKPLLLLLLCLLHLLFTLAFCIAFCSGVCFAFLLCSCFALTLRFALLLACAFALAFAAAFAFAFCFWLALLGRKVQRVCP